MIATRCNIDFAILYSLVGKLVKKNETPDQSIVQKYSDLKAAMFSRYRTLSELLGVALLRQAQTLKSNSMVETSGRDVAMFTATLVSIFYAQAQTDASRLMAIRDEPIFLSPYQASVIFCSELIYVNRNV